MIIITHITPIVSYITYLCDGYCLKLPIMLDTYVITDVYISTFTSYYHRFTAHLH